MFKTILPLLLFFISINSSSQTLFTYGPYSISSQEFLRAYNKNNSNEVKNREKAIKEYLELFINSRLKIREAYDRGYDTLPHVKAEVTNLRNQIIENYMSDPTVMDKLLKEAFNRSLKDIHVGYIFIPLNAADTASSIKLLKTVQERLKKEDFSKIAQEVSKAPDAASNKGDIGWITVFSLPYIFENAIYALSPGKTGAPVRTTGGFHIFKNLGERKAVGKMKAKQILFAFPPGIDDAGKNLLSKKADSIYRKLQAGADFGKLASEVSSDYMTAFSGGTMQEFGVGTYDPKFESAVWSLPKDGAISKPFQTNHGIHIVQRIGRVPVVTDPSNKANEQEIRQKINSDERWKASQDIVIEKMIRKEGFELLPFDHAALWAFTDSLLDRKPLGIGKSITPASSLFKLGDTIINAEKWIPYAQAYRYKRNGSGRISYEDLLKEQVKQVAMRYYRDHLENYNEEFRNQMNEFRDGNLFFEIMQQEIWNRAHTDSTQLIALFEKNRSKYNWEKSADAVLFFCADQQICRSLHEKVAKNPKNWKQYSLELAEKVVADSSRFEWTQLPIKQNLKDGMVTVPVLNNTDNTSTFAYIIKIYPNPTPRNFQEAKGLVINDYQAELEVQWLKKLKAKYPVKVDEKVLGKIIAGK